MGKKRIYELAKEINKSSKDVVDKAQALGMDVKNHMGSISGDDEKKLRQALSGGTTMTTSNTNQARPQNQKPANQKPANQNQTQSQQGQQRPQTNQNRPAGQGQQRPQTNQNRPAGQGQQRPQTNQNRPAGQG
ncbi:translation initiation factor IF-2 N-terminal domain-containing protein, partial [Enterococcus phoeniculicola]